MRLLNLTETELRRRTSLKWRKYPADVLPMWVAEMDVRTPEPVRAALVAALDEGDTGYPSGSDYEDAFAAMALDRWGWTVSPEQVGVVSAVMVSMHALLEATTRPGDAVVINPPVYPPFFSVVTDYGRRLIPVPMLANGRLDITRLEEVFAGPEAPRAYLLCSPHNPTGAVHSAEELTAVAKACARHGVALIVDEIHACLVDPDTEFVPILSLPEASHAMVATSAGKAWNLAGFHSGLVIAGADAPAQIDDLPPIARSGSGHVDILAHATALRDAQPWQQRLRVELAANKALLAELLAEHLPEIEYRRQPGTYLAWLDFAPLGLENPTAHFLRAGQVALNPGRTFSPEHHQWGRMNLATSPELIAEGVTRIRASLDR